MLSAVTYGERLKERRLLLGLSQEAMARKLGYRRQGNLSLYENDKKQPTIATILRHAKACDLLPSVLMEGVTTEHDRLRTGAYDDAATRASSALSRETEHLIQRKKSAAARRVAQRGTGKAFAKH